MVACEIRWNIQSNVTDGINYLTLAWKTQSKNLDPGSLAPEPVFLIYYKNILLLLETHGFIGL